MGLFKTQFVFLQQSCEHLSPLENNHGELWKALVCGSNLSHENPWLSTLKSSGLIHIFIVSGSHFLVLQFLLEKLRLPIFLHHSTLWFFNACTGFQAPGTRACLQITTKSFFRMRSDQNLLATSVLCLALCPTWIQSHSFWLSWLASLILTITPRDSFRISANSVFFSIWCALGFSLSLWSLALNILLAPIIGWLLFPLALLAFISPAKWLFVNALDGLEELLGLLNLEPTPTFLMKAISQISFMVLVTHFLLQIYHLRRKGRVLK